jgi:hypothetical protein
VPRRARGVTKGLHPIVVLHHTLVLTLHDHAQIVGKLLAKSLGVACLGVVFAPLAFLENRLRVT